MLMVSLGVVSGALGVLQGTCESWGPRAGNPLSETEARLPGHPQDHRTAGAPADRTQELELLNPFLLQENCKNADPGPPGPGVSTAEEAEGRPAGAHPAQSRGTWWTPCSHSRDPARLQGRPATSPHCASVFLTAAHFQNPRPNSVGAS